MMRDGAFAAVVVTWMLLSMCSAMDFESYVKDFGKSYESEQEKLIRKDIFEANYQEILQHNSNKGTNNEGHFLSVNQWTDRRIPDELPFGLQKKVHGSSVDFLETSKLPSSPATGYYQNWLDTKVVPVSDLPKEVDWRTHTPKITTDVKDQGFCGSCWAEASTTVLESHIALQTGKLFTLSPQELVSCVDNPEHCGGEGGCQGATYELAFEYVMEHGIVLEADFPYKSKAGMKVQCTLKNATHALEGLLLRGTPLAETNYIDGAVATIDGYINFPTNNYTALMNAVATLGPIGVTVAASPWAMYGGGVFKLPDHKKHGATNVNHAVVLEGYGVDQETQEPYWLVRNSWGSKWGESGYIRLFRVDPSTTKDYDDDDCGMDTTPADGAACTKDKNGQDIVPSPVKVCGTTAILFDSFVPVGGRLLSNQVPSESV